MEVTELMFLENSFRLRSCMGRKDKVLIWLHILRRDGLLLFLYTAREAPSLHVLSSLQRERTHKMY